MPGVSHIGDAAALGRELEALHERTRQRIERGDTPQEVVEELEDTLEELQIAQEELRAQNDELLGARLVAEEDRRRYQELFESAPVAYLVTDPSGQVQEANGAAERLLGWHRMVLAGKPIVVLVAVEDRASFRAQLGRVLSAEIDGLDGWEVRLRRRGSVEFPAALAVRAVRDGEGGLVGLRWVLQDVSERQRFERQARLATTGQLAAGIAHDFNNILAAVLAFADLLRRDESLPEAVRGKMQLIAGQARRGSQLVRQILDFALGTRGEREPVDLVAFLREVVRLLERTMPENISITVTLPDEPCVVEADEAKLQQVLTNLAVNGRDAMPDGGRLGVELSRFTVGPGERPPVVGMPPGEWAVLSLSDSGTGMTREVRGHIFEPFFTTKGPDKGSGLGLAQVYGVVTQHGGWVVVRSEPGAGTTFDIFLPLGSAAGQSAGDGAEALPRGKGEVVLLVEDYAAVNLGSAAMLEHLGYRVLQAEHGEQALELWARQHERIALVLTDRVLPGMSGSELYQALRRRGATVPILMMSGYPAGTEHVHPRNDVSGWLRKPFEMGELAEAVQRALRDVLSA